MSKKLLPIFNFKNLFVLLFSFNFLAGQVAAQVSTDAIVAYSLRKLNPSYTGQSIQVRRSCDNATTTIGFTACGDLDTVALKNFVNGAPALSALGTSPEATFSLRKLGCTYSGASIRVRRSCDNAETDIGFTTTGDLDTVALKNFVFSAGPLNLISTSAAVAYSLRRLRCAYTGPIIRVRRTSDNAEVDVAFDVAGSLSASSVCTVTAVGTSGFSVGGNMAFSAFYSGTNCSVTTWYDQSGNGKNLVQTTTGNQPRIVNAGNIDMHNGKPAINFNGSNQFFAETTQTFSNAYSLHVVASRSAAGGCCGGYQRFINISSSSDEYGFLGTLAGDFATFAGNGSVWNDINANLPLNNIGTASAATIFTVIYGTGANGLLPYINGSALAAKNGTTTTGTGFTVGGVYNGSNTNQIWNGYISEVIDFASSLSASERQKLEYLQSVYYTISGPVSVAINSTSSDAFVTTWYDQSGNGRNATQVTLSNQPRIMNDGAIERQNTKPALRFLTVNSGLTTAPFTAFNTAACFNGVAKVNANITYNAIVSKTGSGSNANIPAPIDFYNARNVVGNGVGYVFRDVAQTFNAAKPLGIWTFRAQVSGSFDAYYNGSGNLPSGAVGTTFSDVGNPLCIGRRADGATGLDGWISEILTFSSFPSNADRQYFEYTQALYYGIAGPVYANPTNPPSGYVATWYDQTGNGNHAIQTTITDQPQIINNGQLIYTTQQRPAIRFGLNNNTRMVASGVNVTTGTNRIISSIQTITTNKDFGVIWSNNSTNNFGFHSNNSGIYFYDAGSFTPVANSNNTFINVLQSLNAYNNGSNYYTFGAPTNLSGLCLGNIGGGGAALDGNISEFIFINNNTNSSRRTILENNQAEYFGIAGLSNDIYTPTDASYNRGGNGIGFQSTLDSVQKVRVSRGFILEDDASSSTNFLRNAGDYIFAAVNCNTAPGTTTANLSQGVVQRWTTDWEVKRTDVSNNGGDVRFIFDFGDYWQSGMLPGAGVSNYVLLKRTSSSGTFDTLAVSSKAVVGDQVIFTFDASNVNTFFTLGTVNLGLAPLPVEMVGFACQRSAANRVVLKWKTASEDNCDYFVVERSSDGRNFIKIGTVKGAGTSHSLKSYIFTDEKSLNGITYYRLNQFDITGEHESGEICVVKQFNTEISGGVNIYPNPASTSITLELNAVAATKITVTNTLGAVLYQTPVRIEQSNIQIDCSHFLPGMYLVRIETQDQNVIYEKVIIQK